jgi:hypothetical protein
MVDLKVTNLVCVTYQPHQSLIPYHFIAKTEAEARAKFDAWFNKKPTKAVETKEAVVKASPGTGQANTGKLWMINHTTKERLRIDPTQAGIYLNKGFEHGGPRTQFRS